MSAIDLAISASLGISWTIVAERAVPLLLAIAGIFFYLRYRRPRGLSRQENGRGTGKLPGPHGPPASTRNPTATRSPVDVNKYHRT